MGRYTRILAALSLGAAVASPAQANGLYVGAGFGTSEVDFGDLAGSFDSLDDRSGTAKAFAGYRPVRLLALETFYVNLHEYSATLGTELTRAETTGFGAAVLLFLPITEKSDLFARYGGWRWDVKSITTSGGTVTASERRDDTAPVYGIGLHLGGSSPSASTRIEYERFIDVGENVTNFDDVHVNMLTLSIIYTF